MTGHHVHTGRFEQAYYDAREVFEAIFASGIVNRLLFSSTTSCVSDVTYRTIVDAIEAALRPFRPEKTAPLFWFIPNYIAQGVNVETAKHDMPHGGFKLHPYSAGEHMSLEVARQSIDWIFSHVPDYADGVEIDFIGGEPLLAFPLIKEIVGYVYDKRPDIPFIFFATTNGTVLDDDMKAWFTAHRSCFWLGLSLDGNRATHNHNRCNSFDAIDIDFFLRNWPDEGIKMTLSEYSLQHLAEDVKYLHSLGFQDIGGVNLYEGTFDWDKDEYITTLIPQLAELAEYYAGNDTIHPCQLFDKELNVCESQSKERKKWCGIGTGTMFFDVDGRRYPCSFVTPMTFTRNELDRILETDFSNDENFIDEECFNDCYIYPICSQCSGANYMVNKTFRKRNRSKCRIQKLIALFIADMEAKRIAKNPKRYDDTKLYYTIEAIKKIREAYLGMFEGFMEEQK